MAGGYFRSATETVELGEIAPGLPAVTRRVLRRSPYNASALIMPSGGGVLELMVRGQRLRYNLGDAERYAYGLFRALARSGPGRLGIEDILDRQSTFGGALCVGAALEVPAFNETQAFCDMRFTFIAPEVEDQPAWEVLPTTPAAYAGTSTLQNYAIGGMQIGDRPARMRLEMLRIGEMREVPRARGARAVVPHEDAHFRFTVEAYQVSEPPDSLAEELQDLERAIGPGPGTLSGNGVNYINCVLERLEPVWTDARAGRFEAAFVRRI